MHRPPPSTEDRNTAVSRAPPDARKAPLRAPVIRAFAAASHWALAPSAAIALLLGVARPAHAADPIVAAQAGPGRDVDRPYTLAQLGVGFFTLPGADVCLKSRPCTKGDTSAEVDFWQLYRASPQFAIGAGASVGIKPTTDSPQSEAGVERSHSRSFFLVEGQARFYPLHTPLFEAWLGATAGAVIVSDRYSIDGAEMTSAAIVGPLSSTLRTEGATVGGLVGWQWSFASNWAVGVTVRYMRWFLPHNPETTVFLDRATLTDQQNALNFGLSCSYRIAL